jgi:hypothetical protein
MIRRLNYTGRVKIHRRDVRLSTRTDEGPPSFDADLRLTDYELPADALVFVEAYRQTTWMRFPFGTAAVVRPPADRRLAEFDSPDGILFRVKVTQARDEHILLAAADRIPLASPEELDADHDSLLPVNPAELGDELWQLDMDGAEPELLVTVSAVADWRQLARSTTFMALVYPEIVRQVLQVIVIEEKHRDTDDDTDWKSKWLRFAGMLPGIEPNPPDTSAGDGEARDWIEQVVAAFAKKMDFKVKFAAAWHSKEGA